MKPTVARVEDGAKSLDSYSRWLAYEEYAHKRVLTSLKQIPYEKRGISAWGKAVALLAHVVAGRRMWLHLLEAGQMPSNSLLSGAPSLEDVEKEWHFVRQQWADYFARSNDTELTRVVEYSYDGRDRFRSRVEDILAELFGHSGITADK